MKKISNKVFRLVYILGVFAMTNSYADAAYKIIAGKPHDPKRPKYIEIYGHRGARSFAPENVIPGYKTSLKIGVDWVDMDIVITKDNILVVSHDLWLNPNIISENGKFWAKSKEDFIKWAPKGKNEYVQPYLIKNLTLSELQEYEAGIINPNSTYAKYFPDQIAIPGTHIPTLQEVITYVNKTTNKKMNFQIEIKQNPDYPDWSVSAREFASILYAMLQKNNLIHRVEIQSSSWDVLYELQHLNSKVKTAYILGHDDKDLILNPDPKIAGSWTGGKLLKNYNNSFPQMVKALGGACYEPEDVLLTKRDLDEAHQLGLKVVVWSWPEHTGKAFDPQMVLRLIDWGVDGIITDDPGRLASMLAARGYPVPKRYNAK